MDSLLCNIEYRGIDLIHTFSDPHLRIVTELYYETRIKETLFKFLVSESRGVEFVVPCVQNTNPNYLLMQSSEATSSSVAELSCVHTLLIF